MNASSIEVLHLPTGYAAYYTAAFKTGRVEVMDANGSPARFGTYEKDENAAYKALFAEENKVYALRFDPSQVRPSPRIWEKVRAPKSRAGRRILAESVFKKMEAAE